MSNIPNFHEVRFSLDDVLNTLQFYIGEDNVINGKETLRLMIGQYFYGETPRTVFPTSAENERTLVWPIAGQTIFGHLLDNAFDALGEVFWSLADKVNNFALSVNSNFQHRPCDCFYKYFSNDNKLVVYVPVMGNGISTLPQLAGPAVVINCSDTLPSYYRK